MASRLQLNYELAQIELNKRQLQLENRKLELERQELDVKQRLPELNSVDLTEDESLVKLEPHFNGIEQVSAATRTSSPAKPSRESSTTNLIARSVNTGEKTDSVEQTDQKLEGSNVANTTADNQQLFATKTEPTQYSRHYEFPIFSPMSDSWLPETPTDHQGLLAKFMGRPEPTISTSQTSKKRARAENDDEIEAEIPSKAKRVDPAENELDAGSKRKLKLEQLSRAQSAVNTENTDDGAMTECQEHDLISHYTDRFLRHMEAAELRSRPRVDWVVKIALTKNTVASKVRRNNFRRIHASITILHREFGWTITDNVKNPVWRANLQKDLEKFESALPYWPPKCKALPRQQDRLVMITKMIEAIANDTFEKKDYEHDYDPYNEL